RQGGAGKPRRSMMARERPPKQDSTPSTDHGPQPPFGPSSSIALPVDAIPVRHRLRRRHRTAEDVRWPAQKDRDRVLYTTAFRRLAGVTQVASPREGHIIHNRLTHSLEVAQVARRLAEGLIRK